MNIRAGDTGGAPGGHGRPTFLGSKKKKGKQRKARKTFKVETIKRLSLRSKCYCFSYSRASRTQRFFLSAKHSGRQYFSVFHGPSTLKSISPTLNIWSKFFKVWKNLSKQGLMSMKTLKNSSKTLFIIL